MTEFKILLVVLALSVFVRSFLLHPVYSDEAIYFNAGRYILLGKTIYKDYFLSHPPLQIYFYSVLFKIFGANFFVGKTLYLLLSTACSLLIFFIAREIFGKRVALASAVVFLFTPSFIIFSLMGNGIWETMLLVLISFYMMLKNRLQVSSFIFSAALFTRYLSIIYLPFFLFYIYFKGKRVSKFLVPFMIFSSIFLIFLIFAFGSEYINQTVIYHFFKPKGTPDFSQYLSIGFFTLFLSIIAVFLGFIKKDRMLMFFAAAPLLADMLILLFARPVFYHYFLISVPFLCISLGKILVTYKYKTVKIAVVVILLLSIFSNFQTIDFYLNPKYSDKFYHTSDFVQKNVLKNETIFGEPVMTNFVSFTAKIEICGDYLDSYLQHISFEGDDAIINRLEKNPPKIFIDMVLDNKSYYLSNSNFMRFISNYTLIEKIDGIPQYVVYYRK